MNDQNSIPVPDGWERGAFVRVGVGTWEDQFRPDVPPGITDWQVVEETPFGGYVVDFKPITPPEAIALDVTS